MKNKRNGQMECSEKRNQLWYGFLCCAENKMFYTLESEEMLILIERLQISLIVQEKVYMLLGKKKESVFFKKNIVVKICFSS